MNVANDITGELENMGSVLAGMPRGMPYAVPADYFEGFTAMLQQSIPNSGGATEEIWSKQMPYQVPAGYFDTLSGEVMNTIAAENISAAFPAQAPFQVPAGYFALLPSQVLQAAKQADSKKRKATIIPLRRPGFLRWSVAAVLFIMVGFGAYISFWNTDMPNSDRILSSISGTELHDYVQHTYRLDVDRIVGYKEINNVQFDDKDIINYLDENGWD